MEKAMRCLRVANANIAQVSNLFLFFDPFVGSYFLLLMIVFMVRTMFLVAKFSGKKKRNCWLNAGRMISFDSTILILV